MRGVTIKHSLLALLVVFGTMIVVGGLVGVFALDRANNNALQR
jgi:methyl-accepting chemotaxis protein